ncbi:MAG: sugar phosphate isomerase/epimerase family protein, partial [Planctomycetota bacterium]
AARRMAEDMGMKIHSVLCGWADFNQPAEVEKSIDVVETGLRAAQAYGAGVLLLVPCRVKGMAMPQPGEFNIQFDEKTGHVERVVSGDNTQFAEYIAAHNRATDATRKAVRRLIPTAEKCGVVIALENVWNNLWVKPKLFANLVRSFDSPWVQAYYDIGNHVKYAPPQEWIEALGSLIARVHIKDFRVGPGERGGEFVEIREGDVNWPATMQKLDEVGYHGWLTIEGGKLPAAEQGRRLDLIIARK